MATTLTTPKSFFPLNRFQIAYLDRLRAKSDGFIQQYPAILPPVPIDEKRIATKT